MNFILLTQNETFLIGWVAKILGMIMNGIFYVIDFIGLPNVGLAIILFTIVVNLLMMPLTVKQQKFSKLSAKMNPELQAIQAKYKNKKDNDSMMAQNQEIQAVYAKYGVSPSGSCVQLLIQMPLLFALYPVIYDVERYVQAIKNATADVQKFLTIPDISMSPSQMMAAKTTFDVSPVVIVITCVALPAISALTQYISLKLSQKITGSNQQQSNANDMAAQTMKSMNITMPLFSLWMVYSLSAGIGVYWIVSAVVRCIQQVIINKYLDTISIEDIVEKNRAKAEKKLIKREVRSEKMNEMAQMNAKNIETKNSNKNKSNKTSKSSISDKERVEKLKNAEASRNNAKAGSLASKANMVKKYNENK